MKCGIQTRRRRTRKKRRRRREEEDDEEDDEEEEEGEEEEEDDDDDDEEEEEDDDSEAETEEKEQARQKVKDAARGLLNENARTAVLHVLNSSANQDLLAKLAFGPAADGLSLQQITDGLAKDPIFVELYSMCNTQGLKDLGNMPVIGLQSRLTILSTHLIHLLALLLGSLAFPRTGDTALVAPAAPMASCDFPDPPSAATRPKAAAKPCADLGTLVATLTAKIGDLSACLPQEVLQKAYVNLCNLYASNPFTPQSLRATAAARDCGYIHKYQDRQNRPTNSLDLNTPLQGGRRNVLFQFVVKLSGADDALLALLDQTSKKKVFPHGRVIHWGEQKAVYLGLDDYDAQLSTARFIIKKAREWLLAPGALKLWAHLHANAADKFEWTHVRRNGGEAVPVPSNALRLAGNVLLLICDLADEDLDSESCAARPVHALLLKLLAHQHARFFDGTCNSAGSKDWPWRFQLFLGNVAEAHRQCWRLSMENLPRFPLHVELNGSLVGRVEGLDDGTAAATATLKVWEKSDSGGSICNAAVLSKERGIASIVTRAHPDGPLHVPEGTIVDGLFLLSPDTVVRFAKLMNPSSTAIVFCIDAPTITKTAVLKVDLVQLSLRNTARSVCSFWCRQPLRIGLVSDACAVHLLRDGTLSFGPAHEACIVLEARTEKKFGLLVIHSNDKASDSFLDAASVAQYELSAQRTAQRSVLRGTRAFQSLGRVGVDGIACFVRVDPEALGWPMRLRLGDPLTPAETKRVAELRVKVPDCNEHERCLLLLEFYVQNLMADEERRKSRSHYAYHSPSVKEVEQEIDQHVRDSTESAEDTLQSVLRKLKALPLQMQELFLANVLDMSPPYRSSGVVPLVPGLYTATLAELIETMQKSVPQLAFDEARTMCLKAGNEKPPAKEDRHFDRYLITPRSKEAWVEAANEQHSMALGYSRLSGQWQHVVRAPVPRPESISETIDAQHAIALEFCRRVDSRLYTEADETAALGNATLAHGLICMYQRAVKVLSAFLTVRNRCKHRIRKVSELKPAFRPLFEAINTLRLESSEVFEKKYSLYGLAEQDDVLSLRMATTLHVSVDVDRTSKEDLDSNPLAARMIIERMGPLLVPLDGLVYFLSDTPPAAWKEKLPPLPPQEKVFCHASTAVVLVHLGNGSRVFVVLTDISTAAGEKPQAAAKKLCETSAWFTSSRQPKRRSEGDVGSSSAGNGKKKKKKTDAE